MNGITLIDFPISLSFVWLVIGRLLCARVVADIKGTKAVYSKGLRAFEASRRPRPEALGHRTFEGLRKERGDSLHSHCIFPLLQVRA